MCRVYLWSHLVLDFCQLRVLKITDSISFLIISLFIFSILPDSVLGEYVLLGTYPFLLVCPFYWQLIVVSIATFPLSFMILFIWTLCLFFLFFTSLVKVLSIYLFKELALRFIYIFCCFLSISFFSALIFFSFLFFSFLFLEKHPCHMEVPRLEVTLELQPLPYTTATAMWDPSYVCNL